MSLTATGYKTPPQNIMNIFDKTRPPHYSFVAYSEMGFEVNYQRYQTLEQMSDPVVKLAGEEISIRLNAPRDKYPTNYFAIDDFETGEKIKVDFPADIRIRDYKLSNDRSKIAFLQEVGKGLRLIVVETASGRIKYFDDFYLNDAFTGTCYSWLNDNSLLLKIIPENRREMPQRPLIPNSPVIEETSGKVSNVRTYQNLLQDEFDEILFDYFFTSQLAILNPQKGNLKIISEPKIWDDVKISPDNKHIFTNRINKPYSYQVPYWRFPQTYEVLGSKGKVEKVIFERALQDQIPIGGTYKGPRRFRWQPLHDAALVWIEALDEGDPKIEVEHRDKIMRQEAPFKLEPEELFRTEYRYSSISWSQEKDEVIYSEYDRDRIWIRNWLYKIGSNEVPKLLFDISRRDQYSFPGKLISKKTQRGERVFLKQDNFVYYNNDIGASPEGRFPYLSKMDLLTMEAEILWKCEPGHYEIFRSFLNEDLSKIVINSENNESYRQYYFVELATKERYKFTNYANPYPEITDLKTELITYTRKDSIPLSATLVLPADYQQGDRLPLIYEAYPQEFTDASTAGQVTNSSNRFPNFWGASTRYLVLEGYAVLVNASIPIIGDPETVNETFIEQTVSSVEAAINYLDERGIIDPARVGVTGHSYGAFMVANVLAHSNICAAGVAKSGAYNRTLTPFGFQSERRTLWNAKDFYLEVSPFMHAENIKEPLLLIHGEDDPNSGTFPIQSKRFYQALKGNGGTAKLVILPREGHGYSARESLLHVLAETVEWFDKYVKNRKINRTE